MVARWERLLDRAVLALGRSIFGPSGDGHVRGVLHIFLWADQLSSLGRVIKPLRPGGYLSYEITPFPRGRLPLAPDDGVDKGEPVIMLHLDNETMARLNGSVDSPRELWGMYYGLRADLRALAGLVARGEVPSGVRVVWAETLLYRTLSRLGFRTRPAPRNLRRPFARLYMLGLLAIYRSDGLRRLERGEMDRYQLGEAWMTVEELLCRFGEGAVEGEMEEQLADGSTGD